MTPSIPRAHAARRCRFPRSLRTVAALVAVACLPACGGPQGDPRLAADNLLGSTAESLTERLGEPRATSDETPHHWGSMRWEDVEGVDVFIAFRDAKAIYVTYHFSGEEPFDEDAALARIGVQRPEEPGTALGDGGARRWQPFGDHERLTINPATRLISIGTNPF